MRLSSLVRLVFTAALAAILLIVLAPGCGRSSLESETLDSGTTQPPGSCSATTCPTGCCDAQGQCRLGSDTRASTDSIYWEGAVRALQHDREVGRGYLELTGYWRPLKL